MKIKIQNMDILDLEDIYRIETTANKTPWSRELLYHCLLAGYQCLTMVSGRGKQRQTVGFCINRLYDDTAHILNLTIKPDWQGKGLGRQFLQYLLADYSSNEDIKRAMLEVRIGNERAIRLYEQEGFYPIDRKESYYKDEDGCEEALVLEKKIL